MAELRFRYIGWVLCALSVTLGACSACAPDTYAEDGGGDACVGLQCSLVDCASQGLPPTAVSGTVYAPNGTLPLYGVTVYVPMSDPGPLASGAQCARCSDPPLGGAWTQTLSDETGHFRLTNVPAGQNVPLVIQVGKWRRQIVLPNVSACSDLALPKSSTTLPKNRSEGDMPQIAITTGDADALDCLVRKLGIDDAEITTDNQGGRVHLYNGNGAQQFANGFDGGIGTFASATMLWGDLAKLSAYDLVLFSCEGTQHPETKSQAAMQAVHDYAGNGGRLLMTHWHNIWIGGERGNPSHGLADWESVATFDYMAMQNESTQLTVIDETASKGTALASWLLNVGASATRDQLVVNGPRYTCQSVDPNKGERWVYVDPNLSTPLGKTGDQIILFTTPQDQQPDHRCGKVLFSDMHVSADSSSKAGTPYPGGCSTQPLTPQETALAFMFFDISSCVGPR